MLSSQYKMKGGISACYHMRSESLLYSDMRLNLAALIVRAKRHHVKIQIQRYGEYRSSQFLV